MDSHLMFAAVIIVVGFSIIGITEKLIKIIAKWAILGLVLFYFLHGFGLAIVIVLIVLDLVANLTIQGGIFFLAFSLFTRKGRFRIHKMIYQLTNGKDPE